MGSGKVGRVSSYGWEGMGQRRLLARTIHDGSWRKRVPREAYLVIRARLARLARKAGVVSVS
jgi:hypothetical protein